MGEIPVIKPEVCQRIYCKNCGQDWATNKTVDVTVKILEMPSLGADSGE